MNEKDINKNLNWQINKIFINLQVEILMDIKVLNLAVLV